MPYIGTNLQLSISCLGFLVTKFWPNLICLGKQGKWENKNILRKEKNMRYNRGKFYFFASCLLRLVKVPMLTEIHSIALSNEARIPRLLGFFLQQEIFHTSP